MKSDRKVCQYGNSDAYNSSGEEIRIKAEAAMLYECNINEENKFYLDVNKKLEKVK